MGAILDHIKSEWSVLKGAPFSFLALLALGLISGFGGGCLFMSQQLANMQSLLDLKDGQIDSYQKSINERLDKVEKTLSEQQVLILQNTLSMAPSRVGIAGGTQSEYYKKFIEAFKGSGWDVEPTKDPTKEGLVLQADPKSATTIEDALGKAGVKFEAVEKLGGGGTDFYLGGPE